MSDELAKMKPTVFGYLTRADGSKIPIYYIHEGIDSECEIVHVHPDGREEWISTNESYVAQKGWQNRRNAQLTERVRRVR